MLSITHTFDLFMTCMIFLLLQKKKVDISKNVRDQKSLVPFHWTYVVCTQNQ